ncbi:MAG: hypothetical protein GY777_00545 [Candidatus Brocadiaceae bacterium]|nr:hypothetical protein [Candidatus Brocadiaceae bacterium]
MNNMPVVEILRIGVIGLGFLLAFLAYRLLVREQQRDRVRKSFIRATYVFMFFSVVLSIVGLGSEYLSENKKTTQKKYVKQAQAKDVKNLCYQNLIKKARKDFPLDSLAEKLRERPLSYGWSGGIAAERSENADSVNFFKITDVVSNGDNTITIYYAWQSGSGTSRRHPSYCPLGIREENKNKASAFGRHI